MSSIFGLPRGSDPHSCAFLDVAIGLLPVGSVLRCECGRYWRTALNSKGWSCVRPISAAAVRWQRLTGRLDTNPDRAAAYYAARKQGRR